MAEPFNDAAFMSRLQKLVSMLGSEQPGEADTARRKLVEHLGHHRLSLTDVADRLRVAPAPRTATPGFEEMSLERELYVARVARQEAEGDVHRARQRVVELSRSLQEATFDAGRAVRGQARARLVAGAGWLAAALACLLVLLQHFPSRSGEEANAMPAGTQTRTVVHRQVAAGDIALQAGPGEENGTVLVQDLAVRLTPNEDGSVRAFLNRGMQVVIERQAHVGLQNWLLIRSVTGRGWVRGGDVLH